MKVLVIIPCYNEEKTILQTVEKIKGTNYDYIVINDGSKDNSLKILEANKINHLNLPNNIGIGGAVQTGYKYAYKNNYDIAVQFDGDGQHNEKYIKNIIKSIEQEEANMVIGSRFVWEESDFKSTKLRRIGITILSKLLKILTKYTIKDMTSGFRAVDRSIIEIFQKDYPDEFPEPVTNLSLAKRGFKIKEIPVKMQYRKHGKSSINSIKSAYYMFNVILLFLIISFSKGDD